MLNFLLRPFGFKGFYPNKLSNIFCIGTLSNKMLHTLLLQMLPLEFPLETCSRENRDGGF